MQFNMTELQTTSSETVELILHSEQIQNIKKSTKGWITCRCVALDYIILNRSGC